MSNSFVEKSAAIRIPIGSYEIRLPFSELLFGPSDTHSDLRDLLRIGLIGVGGAGALKALSSLMLYKDPYFFSAPSNKTYPAGSVTLKDIVPEPQKPSAKELMLLKQELSDKKDKEKHAGFQKTAAGLSLMRFVDLALRHPILTFGAFAAAPASFPLLDEMYKGIRKKYVTHHANLYKNQFLNEVKRTVAVSNLAARNDLRLEDIQNLPEETKLDIRNRLLSETGKDYSRLLGVSPAVLAEAEEESKDASVKSAGILTAPLDIAAFPFKQLFSYGLLAGIGLLGLPLISGVQNLQSVVRKYPPTLPREMLKSQLEQWQAGAYELEEEGGYVNPPSSFFKLRSSEAPLDYEHPSAETYQVSRAVERKLQEMRKLENMETEQARQVLRESARADAKNRGVKKTKVRKTTIIM